MGGHVLGLAETWLRAVFHSGLARNAGKLSAGEAVGLVLGLVQAAFVARWLGPADFGVGALVLGFPALVFTVFDPRAAEAVVKYLGEFMARGEPRRALAVPKLAYAVDLALAVVGLGVVAAGASWTSRHLLNAPGHADLLVLAAGAQALAAPADTSRAILTSFGRFGSLARLQIVVTVLRCASVLAVVAAGGGVDGFVAATCVATVLDALLLGWLAGRSVRTAFGCSWRRGRIQDVAGRLREVSKFLIYTDLSSLVAVFVKQADIVVLGAVRGPVEAGYYRLARSLASPATSIIVSLQAVLYPQIARLASGADRVDLLVRTKRWFLWAGLPAALASLTAVPFVPRIIEFVAGQGFLGATGAACWSLVGSAVVMAFFWLRPVLLATGQVRVLLVTTTLTGVLSVVGFVVLAGPFGAGGVAAARTLFAAFGGSVVAAVWLRRSIRANSLVDDAAVPGIRTFAAT